MTMSAHQEDHFQLCDLMGGREQGLELIAIGSSAGGINALLSILSPLPKTLRLPIVVVLHVAEDKQSKLVDVFAHHLAPRVVYAQDKAFVVPDTVYFAPSGYHLSIEKGRWFSLSREEPRYFSRPSIDYLMMSAADVYGEATLGILLTGASEDGAEGMASISAAGGFTVVQNPADAEFSVMPEAAIKLHKPQQILSLHQIRKLVFLLETFNVG